MTNTQKYSADPAIVATWLKGWSIARSLPPPVPDQGALRVDVGWPDQKKRYVFAEVGQSFKDLAASIHEPLVFLKACAGEEEVRALLPSNWEIQTPAYMMRYLTQQLMNANPLPEGYTLSASSEDKYFTVAILDPTGFEVANGGLVLVDDYGIYDRIATHPRYQRKGFASIIMQSLQKISHQHNVYNGILVATPPGRNLYDTLGWELYSPYTTAVIPSA